MDVHFSPPATAPPVIANGNFSSSLSFHNLDWDGEVYDSDSRDPTRPLQVPWNCLDYVADALILLCYVVGAVERTACIIFFGFLSFSFFLNNRELEWKGVHFYHSLGVLIREHYLRMCCYSAPILRVSWDDHFNDRYCFFRSTKGL